MSSKKFTTEDFIEKAKKVNGDRYDYSLVEYVNAKTKVKIVCKKHGFFEQNTDSHLRGNGCPSCSHNKRLTTEEFIKKAKEIHGDKYNYSNVVYSNNKIKVKIICHTHGEFLQTPAEHLSKSGCSKCAYEKSSQKQRGDKEDFIKRAIKIHGYRYDYSKIEYIRALTKVKIICSIHGEFLQTPAKHLMNNGCPKCVGKNKTTEDIIEEFKLIHGNKYDYSRAIYINAVTNIKIVCKIKQHGYFLQTPDNHLHGNGCPKCVGKNKTTEDIIEEFKLIHGNKYNYNKVEYKKHNSKIVVICPKHGDFLQSSNQHLRGNGCPVCNESKGERKIRTYLNDNFIKYKVQKKFDDCKYEKKLPFDFYLPEYNLCIEYDGEQHYKPTKFNGISDNEAVYNLKNVKKRDEIKNEYCKINNIKLLRIKYDQFNNIEKIIKNVLISV